MNTSGAPDSENERYFGRARLSGRRPRRLDPGIRRKIRAALRHFYESRTAINEREILENLNPMLQAKPGVLRQHASI